MTNINATHAIITLGRGPIEGETRDAYGEKCAAAAINNAVSEGISRSKWIGGWARTPVLPDPAPERAVIAHSRQPGMVR
jgi:hypothetical protein